VQAGSYFVIVLVPTTTYGGFINECHCPNSVYDDLNYSYRHEYHLVRGGMRRINCFFQVSLIHISCCKYFCNYEEIDIKIKFVSVSDLRREYIVRIMLSL
jgi:hypothetical protein